MSKMQNEFLASFIELPVSFPTIIFIIALLIGSYNSEYNRGIELKRIEIEQDKKILSIYKELEYCDDRIRHGYCDQSMLVSLDYYIQTIRELTSYQFRMNYPCNYPYYLKIAGEACIGRDYDNLKLYYNLANEQKDSFLSQLSN